MAFVIQTPGTRETIPGLRERIASGLESGIGEGFEQDALSQLTSKIQQGEDPMQAVLNSRLPAARQRELISGFQKQEEIKQRGEIEAAKVQEKRQIEAQKLKQQQQQLSSTSQLVEQLSGGKINADQLQGAPQATLNSIVSNFTKPRDIQSPLEQGFSKIQDGILNKVPTMEQNISDANRSLELARTGKVGVDFEKGTVTDKLRGGLRLAGVNIGQTADEAQLSNLILRRADELKRKFGSRITNFDFEKWLEGQPATSKFRNANIALATMQKKEAEVDRNMFDAWQDIVSNNQIAPDDRLNALLAKQREILQQADEDLDQELNTISTFDKVEPVSETIMQIRDRANREPKVDNILNSIDDQMGQQLLLRKLEIEEQKRGR